LTGPVPLGPIDQIPYVPRKHPHPPALPAAGPSRSWVSKGPVVSDVRLDAQALHGFLRAEASLGVGSAHDVPGGVDGGLVLPLGDGHDVELARSGDLLQDGVTDEAGLPAQQLVGFPNSCEKLVPRRLGHDELVDTVNRSARHKCGPLGLKGYSLALPRRRSGVLAEGLANILSGRG